MRREWKTVEIAKLHELAPTCSLEQAATMLGRSWASVQSATRQHGIAFRKRGESHQCAKYSDAVIRRAWAMKGWGRAPKVIAEETGISLSALRGYFYYGERKQLAPEVMPSSVRRAQLVRAL